MSNIKGQQITTLSAEGFVTGKVTEANGEAGVFVHESGESFPCKIAPGLEDSPNFGSNQLYKVYPYNKKETGLNFLIQEEVADEPSDVFDFVAKVNSIGEGEFTVAVWSNTNQKYCYQTKTKSLLVITPRINPSP